MNNRLDQLLSQIHQLEKELVRETQKKEAEFCYKVRAAKVEFTAEATARHKRFRLSIHRFLLTSRWPVLATAPFIWMCLIPTLLLDLVGSVYQAICFPIYGIPQVARRDYLAFDRHHLAYLNFIEKMNCEYCAYANGILAYATEIAARTEQYWCPIKHAQCVKCAHSRYKNFMDFGNAEEYRQEIEVVRRSFQDLPPSPAETRQP